MDISIQLAEIIGPVLVALSISEYLNLSIWKDVHPTLVYLNGLVLLIGGLIVLNMHPFWKADWTITITIMGWLFLLLGLSRMFFPTKIKLQKSLASDLILLVLLLVGVFLSLNAYFFK